MSAPTSQPALESRARDLLAQCSTATLTTQLFGRGLRNTYLAGLRPANPAYSRVVGQAFTLRYIPAREDIDVLSVFQDYDHPQRAAVEQAPPGSVLHRAKLEAGDWTDHGGYRVTIRLSTGHQVEAFTDISWWRKTFMEK